MPDTQSPAWMEWVKAPLLLLAPDLTTIVTMNGAARRLFAGIAPLALPVPLELMIGPEAAALFVAALGAPEGTCTTVEARIGGQPHRLAVEVSAMDAPEGHWLVTVQDRVTEREAGNAISSVFEDLQSFLEWLPVGIEIYDESGRGVFANSHGARLFGWGRDELTDLDLWWPHAYPDPEYRALAMAAWERAFAVSRREGVAVPLADWKVTCKDGSHRFVHFLFRSIADHQVVVYWDVSEERQKQAELRRAADTDELTGLSNRRRFFADAEAAFAQAGDGPASVLMIDVDHFKVINDRHGHAVGDAVLREFAERCRKALGEGILARLGGEEFVALLPGYDGARALQCAWDVHARTTAEPLAIPGGQLVLTCSIGVATASAPFDIDALLARADQALYAAKQGGRNRVHADAGRAAR